MGISPTVSVKKNVILVGDSTSSSPPAILYMLAQINFRHFTIIKNKKYYHILVGIYIQPSIIWDKFHIFQAHMVHVVWTWDLLLRASFSYYLTYALNLISMILFWYHLFKSYIGRWYSKWTQIKLKSCLKHSNFRSR